MRMWRDTAFTRATGARLPVVAAPMAGGPTTPELVAAACDAGAFGVLAAAYTTPDTFRSHIRAVRAHTDAPFGVNVLLPQPYDVDEAQVAAAIALLRPYADELGVDLALPEQPADDVDALLDVALEERAGFLGFTFGIPPRASHGVPGCRSCHVRHGDDGGRGARSGGRGRGHGLR